MTTSTGTAVTTQVYRVYIKATPKRSGTRSRSPSGRSGTATVASSEYDLRPGGAYRALASDAMKKAGAEMGFPTPDVIVDGEVIEADAPRKLVQTWRMLMDPGVAAEGFTRLTYEIAESKGGVSKLTVTHDVEGAPKLAVMITGELEDTGAGGGWSWVLSDLKSLLETGSPMDPGNPLNQG